MSERLNVILPVETIVRELDYRLALGAQVVGRGRRVLIGSTTQTLSLLEGMQRGVYFGKHVFQRWRSSAGPLGYHLAKAHGFGVVHFSEEGAVFMGDDDSARADLDHQFDASILAPDDFLATWGDWQRDHYRQRAPACAANIRTIGHPRFDLYKPPFRALYEEEAARLRARFGAFVLFNTNFGLALHPEGPRFVFSAGEGYDANDPVVRERFVAQWSRVARTVPSFVEVVHRLSLRRPDVNFVIRPHPSDDNELLLAAFAGIRNVHVVREGHVAPWIIASRLMVHDGCTTGMEGYLLGKGVVNYRPVPEDETELVLANSFGLEVTGRDDAVALISRAIDDPVATAQRTRARALPEKVHELLANFRVDSFSRTLELVDEAEGSAHGPFRTPTASRILSGEMRALAFEQAKSSLLRPFSPRRRRSALHARWRFPGFDRATVRHRLGIIRQVLGKDVQYRYYGPNLLELTLG